MSESTWAASLVVADVSFRCAQIGPKYPVIRGHNKEMGIYRPLGLVVNTTLINTGKIATLTAIGL